MSDLVTSLKALGAKMTGKDIAGKNLVSVMRHFGTNLTGENISGNDLIQVIDDITENYTGGGAGGGGTMYQFLLCAQTEEPFEGVSFVGDGNYRGGALPAGVISVYYSSIDQYGSPAVLPLGDAGFIIDAYAAACKIQLESTQGNHLSDDIPYETASGWLYGHTIFAVNYSDIKAAIEAFEAQGYTVKQIKITLQSN